MREFSMPTQGRNKFLRTLLGMILALAALLASACGTSGPPQASPPPGTPRATAMSELPPTWTLEPTLTPSPTPEPSPTPLPTQDPEHYRIDLVLDAAEITYPDQVSDRTGWKLLTGKTASISIPPTYQELDFAGALVEMMFGVMEAFAQGMMDFAGELGEELGAPPPADQPEIDLGQPPEIDFLLALEESSSTAIILASLERTPETTTEDLLNEGLSGSDKAFQVAAREIYTDSPLPMERVILDVDDPELGPGKQIIYAILGPDLGWNLVFTTPVDLYDQNLPIFESVVDSFTILP
jgi:hypothetical protein